MKTEEEIMVETLVDAINTNNRKVVEAIVELGFSKDKVLELAVESSNSTMVSLAIELGAKSVLSQRVLSNFALTKTLLESGANPNEMEFNRRTISPLYTIATKRTPLKSEEIKVAKVLIEHGAEINAKIVSYAICYNQLNLVKLFIEKGLNIQEECNREWDGGETPLYVAFRGNLFQMAKLLVENGATIESEMEVRDSKRWFSRYINSEYVSMDQCIKVPKYSYSIGGKKVIQYKLNKKLTKYILEASQLSLTEEEKQRRAEMFRQMELFNKEQEEIAIRSYIETEQRKEEVEDSEKVEEAIEKLWNWKEEEEIKFQLNKKIAEIVSKKESVE